MKKLNKEHLFSMAVEKGLRENGIPTPLHVNFMWEKHSTGLVFEGRDCLLESRVLGKPLP